jgi:hypothetical protein
VAFFVLCVCIFCAVWCGVGGCGRRERGRVEGLGWDYILIQPL